MNLLTGRRLCIAFTLLQAGLAAQTVLDPGRPGFLRLYPGLPVIPGDLIYLLVPDLVAAAELYKTSFGLALVLVGNPLQLILRLAGERQYERPAQLPAPALLQFPAFDLHVLFPQLLARLVRSSSMRFLLPV